MRCWNCSCRLYFVTMEGHTHDTCDEVDKVSKDLYSWQHTCEFNRFIVMHLSFSQHGLLSVIDLPLLLCAHALLWSCSVAAIWVTFLMSSGIFLAAAPEGCCSSLRSCRLAMMSGDAMRKQMMPCLFTCVYTDDLHNRWNAYAISPTHTMQMCGGLRCGLEVFIKKAHFSLLLLLESRPTKWFPCVCI